MFKKYKSIIHYAFVTSFMLFICLGLFGTAYTRFNYNKQIKTSDANNLTKYAYSKRTEGATSNECRFVVENAVKNGGYEYISCHNDYNEAKNAMNNAEFNNDRTPIIYDRNKSKITNMRGGLVITTNVPSTVNISFFTDSGSEITYFNGQYSNEMAFVDSNISDDGRIKGMIGGYTGWVNEYVSGTYELYLVPLAKVENHPRYHIKNEGGYKSLYHAYNGNTTGSSIGLASDNFNYDTSYYSFDGNNFYTDLISMYNDYRNGNVNNAIIKDYYNYYQYLPFRSKTSYDTNNFKAYLESVEATNNQIYKNIDGFIGTQNTSGINSAMELVFAIHESGWGDSKIANTKNNLFGLGATDDNAVYNAYYFNSIANCIEYHSRRTLSNGYLDAGYYYNDTNYKGDWRYFGSYLGNKKGGVNVKYASDAYWGEKIAGHYYRMDKYLGFKDYNKYGLLIKNNDQVYNLVYKDDPNGKYAYQTNNYDGYTISVESFIIIGETDQYYNVMSIVPIATSSNPTLAKYVANSDGSIGSVAVTGQPPVSQGRVHWALDYNWESSNLYISKNYSFIRVGNSNVVHPKDVGVIPVVNPTPTPMVNIIINYGDVNGDGKINAPDYVLIKNHILGKNNLSGTDLTAADYNKDGKVSAPDYVLVKNHILGR